MGSIEFLGHSGLAIEHGKRLLLCDPWLSPRGAYNASWFQYPEYPRRSVGKLLRPDAVYVSHEHPDHYDPWFLKHLPKDTVMLTGRFHKKRCARKLRQLGFERIIELDDFEAYELAPDFLVRVSVPKHNCAPHWFDSCALIDVGRRRVLNLNDANLAVDTESVRKQQVDVLFSQASPAIWYPLTYTTYAPEQRKRLMAQRRESAIESFVAAAKAVRPKVAIPFAGPPCFFDPELADFFLAPDSMFPTAPISAERLRTTTEIPSVVLKPGDRLLLAPSERDERGSEPCAAGFRILRELTYADFDYERDRRAYYESRRVEKEAIIADELGSIPEASADLFEQFARHFGILIRKNPFFRARIDMRVLFEVTGTNGGAWVVDFRDAAQESSVYAWSDEPCQYRFQLDARNVAQVLRGEFSWEDVLLSFRFRAHRDPDRYNQHLFTFLKMADHGALQAIAKAEIAMADAPDDRFELDVNGARYSVQRFCPLAGSDLREAEVADGFIVCPGHRWHFDLTTGACREADYQIRCARVVERASPDAGTAQTAAPLEVPARGH